MEKPKRIVWRATEKPRVQHWEEKVRAETMGARTVEIRVEAFCFLLVRGRGGEGEGEQRRNWV